MTVSPQLVARLFPSAIASITDLGYARNGRGAKLKGEGQNRTRGNKDGETILCTGNSAQAVEAARSSKKSGGICFISSFGCGAQWTQDLGIRRNDDGLFHRRHAAYAERLQFRSLAAERKIRMKEWASAQ